MVTIIKHLINISNATVITSTKNIPIRSKINVYSPLFAIWGCPAPMLLYGVSMGGSTKSGKKLTKTSLKL